MNAALNGAAAKIAAATTTAVTTIAATKGRYPDCGSSVHDDLVSEVPAPD